MIEVKAGFKKTKLGLIPTEWYVGTVEKVLYIDNTSRKPISEEERQKMQGQYPYYGPTKVQDYINEYQYEGEYALIAEDGDHFLKYRSFPMTQFVTGKFNVNNHAHVIKGTKHCRTKWFYWFFNRRNIYSHLTRQGAGRYKLNKASLSKLLIGYPSISEQDRIIEVLDTWDKAIDTLNQLIAQKDQRKKGLMQQLLSGKKRLPGFSGEWREITIGNCLKESKVPSVENNPERRLSVRLNLKGVEKRDVRGTEAEDSTAFFVRKAGQFIYGKQNLHKGAMGIIPEYLDGYESTQDIPAFDFKKGINPSWFFYFISRNGFYERLENISTGTGSKRIHPKSLFKVKISVPEFKEQQAIAQVLNLANTEIALVQQKLEQLKQQKKGLMQQLLTGKKRLPF